jgi:NADH:ubiquinone reductase (H+-translocating)
MTGHRIVIVGGGVAGLEIASHIARDTAYEVVLIDREPAHVWKPMLHSIAAGTDEVALHQTAYLVQARRRGFAYEPGEAIGVDRDARRVILAPLSVDGEQVLPERSVDYDTLILAIGSRGNDFGTPGVAEHCSMIDSRAQAMRFAGRLRLHLLKSFADRRTLRIGIVGGGATGVQLAAELVRIADIGEDYGAVGLRQRVDITLMEAGPRILPPFPEHLSKAACRKLEEIGITVLTDAQVERVDADGFHLKGGRSVPADLHVWAAGVRAPRLAEAIEGLTRDRTGRVVVDAQLRSKDDPNIFVVGDCASVKLPGSDDTAPATAQAAHQEARYLSRHLTALIAGRSAPPFRYRDFGALVSLGGYDAYGMLGRFGLFSGGFLKGKVAQLGHAMLYRSHQARLHGPVRGSLLWLSDTLAARVRPPEPLA